MLDHRDGLTCGTVFHEAAVMKGSAVILVSRVSGLTPTSENGLVHTQGCGFDGDDSDVSWHFVTN